MAEYDFKCGHCKHEFTLNQPMKAPRPTSCPKCRGTEKFGQVISAPIGVRGEPTTVGSLAEKNTSKLCREDYDRIINAGKTNGLSPQMKKKLEDQGCVVKERKPSGKTPWYRDGSVPGTERSDKPIDLSKIKDVKKFIQTGDKR